MNFQKKTLTVFASLVILGTTFISGAVLLDLSGEKIGIANLIFNLPKRTINIINYQNSIHENLNQDLANVYSEINKLENSLLKTYEQGEASCSNKEDLNICISENRGKRILLQDKKYISNVLDLYDNTTLVIASNTTLIINSDLKWSNYCKICEFGDAAIIRVQGTNKNPISNVHIIINGKLTGTKKTKDNDQRYEGIAFKYVVDSTISGTGIITNIHGDGIDLDASSNILIKDLNIFENSGTGVHLGSPRPLDSNFNIYVRNINSANNGHYFERAGFDNSWPNEFSLILIGNTADSNYINYDIQGFGVIMIDNISTGSTRKDNNLEGTSFNFNFKEN